MALKGFICFGKVSRNSGKLSRQYKLIISWKMAFKPTLIFQINCKNSICFWKISRNFGNFQHNINISFHEKNSFQTHFRILDCLDKFPVIWESFHKFWRMGDGICPKSFSRYKSATRKVFAFSTSGFIWHQDIRVTHFQSSAMSFIFMQ